MPLRYTFRQLEYLVAVGDAGTIALASQRVNVSSPSISAAISQLEAEFGIQIFVRHHAQGLSLTPGGRRIYNEAKRILHDAAALSDIAGDISNKPYGPLSVGALNTIAPLISAAVRRSFQMEYPETTVTLKEAHQADLFNMLGRAEIDIAITYDMGIPNDIDFEKLVALPPFVMLPANHKFADKKSIFLRELENEPMVLLDLPISREYFLSVFQSHGVRANVVERTSDMAMVRSLVANHYGFSLVNMRTSSKTAPDGQELAFLELKDDINPLVLGLATKQLEHQSRVVRAFFEHAKDQVDKIGFSGIELP